MRAELIVYLPSKRIWWFFGHEKDLLKSEEREKKWCMSHNIKWPIIMIE